MSKGLFERPQDEMNAREKTPGITMADILALPDALRKLVNWMIREVEVGLPQIAAHVQKDETSARAAQIAAAAGFCPGKGGCSMSKIISVHSFRGGPGKSNTTANIGAQLALSGKRVGVIDTDIQSPGIHVLFGFDESKMVHSLNDYL